MEFTYESSIFGVKKKLPKKLVSDIRKYLIDSGFNESMTVGQIQDLLLDFRRDNGDRLLINHLHPIYLYLTRNGSFWKEDE